MEKIFWELFIYFCMFEGINITCININYLHNWFQMAYSNYYSKYVQGKIKIKYVQESIGLTTEIHMPFDTFQLIEGGQHI